MSTHRAALGPNVPTAPVWAPAEPVSLLPLWGVTLPLGIFFVMAWAYVYVAVDCQSLRSQLHRNHLAQSEARLAHERLELEVLARRRIRRAEEAAGSLGLVPAATVVHVRAGGTP